MKTRIALYLTVLIIAFPRCAQAQEGIGEYKWTNKIGRGFVNVVTCPLEVIRGIDLTSKNENAPKGWTVGLLKGAGGAVLRVATGVLDLVTFPFNFPDPDKAPLMDPEFAWQDWEGAYHW